LPLFQTRVDDDGGKCVLVFCIEGVQVGAVAFIGKVSKLCF
jgi:hypothetical protein